jgi:hypothetical protein
MIGVTNVTNLVEGYRQAAREIDALTGMEGEIAQASLRSNAAATMAHISTRATGVSSADLAPLDRWIGDYRGGARVERAVGAIDKSVQTGATKVLQDAGTWAMTGQAPLLLSGILSGIAGVVALLINWGEYAGTALAFWAAGGVVIPGGVLYHGLRGAVVGVQEGAQQMRTTWASASTIGSQAQRVLETTSLPVERDVWRAVGGAPHPGVPLVERARLRAQLIVGGVLGVLGVGALIFIYGVIKAYNEYNAAMTGTGF